MADSRLWRASEHEALAGVQWSEERARAAIAAIVADTEAAFDGTRWPWHPGDGDEDEDPNDLYFGGAGVAWALTELGSTGWEDVALSRIDRWRAAPLLFENAVATSYHFGELGAALTAFGVTRDSGVADRVHELVCAEPSPETWEVMAGSPGVLLAAEAMLAWTGEQRWDDAWRAAAERVLAARDADGLWTQFYVGREFRFLGPAHGYAGIIRALTNRGEAPAPADLSAYVTRDDGLLNWDPATDARPDEIRVQWCHGAPGMVATLGDLLDLDDALAGGELTWRAGPLAKGSGLCHGTTGNAYAFLALHQRTGDELWLERARAFAMHALAQVERERAALGRGRYSLMTGDIGVALFLRDLLAGDDRFPTMGPF